MAVPADAGTDVPDLVTAERGMVTKRRLEQGGGRYGFPPDGPALWRWLENRKKAERKTVEPGET
jgi:hypothetical protein